MRSERQGRDTWGRRLADKLKGLEMGGATWASDDFDAEFERMWRTRHVSGVAAPKPVDPIETAADDVLIFELIKRGYAVAKMPADELAKEVHA
jgi:hypothetical protein